MMSRFFASVFIGLVLGAAAGIALGFGPLRVNTTDNPASSLAQQYKDEYVIMIAVGFVHDNDVNGALDRLGMLGVENAPAYVQEVTERYITSSRDFSDIQYLVALSEGLGRITPPMLPYRFVNREAAP